MKNENIEDGSSSSTSVLDLSNHVEMVKSVHEAMDYKQSSPFLKLMLRAMIDIGCPVDEKKHVVVENCKPHFDGLAATDTSTNQVIICEDAFKYLLGNKFKHKLMNALDVNLTHELIHMFDHCRANVDFYDNPVHKMCTEIRAASLSGVCAGLKTLPKMARSHQKCVKNVAMRSFRMMEADFTDEEANSLMRDVFPSCYGDHEPFDRIPVSTQEAKLSYKAYLTRNRYML